MLNMKKTLVLQLLMVLNLLLIYPVLVVARTGALVLQVQPCTRAIIIMALAR